jgi:hypothetical protein
MEQQLLQEAVARASGANVVNMMLQLLPGHQSSCRPRDLPAGTDQWPFNVV